VGSAGIGRLQPSVRNTQIRQYDSLRQRKNWQLRRKWSRSCAAAWELSSQGRRGSRSRRFHLASRWQIEVIVAYNEFSVWTAANGLRSRHNDVENRCTCRIQRVRSPLLERNCVAPSLQVCSRLHV
jgi:hypothetical protein